MTVDYCNLLSTEREYRILLDIVWSHNKSSSYPTLHCCQTVNARNTRNQFSALYSKSESDISDYRSAEEKSPNRTEDHPHPKALTPKENEFDLLASSTIIEGVEPLEPIPETTLWNINQKLWTKPPTWTQNWNGNWRQKWICQIEPPHGLWWEPRQI